MDNLKRIFHQLSSAKYFYPLANRLIPWLSMLCVAAFSYGLIKGLFFAPPDYQQGDAFRIIYVHVPSALMSLAVYAFMVGCALLSFIWRIKLADIAIKISAPLGAGFTFLALLSGALWGKPMWGAYWVWDARLTSELILLFIYAGIMGLRSAIIDEAAAAQAVRLLVLIGAVNIPIVHYSVYWWNTLHQGATIKLFSPSLIAPTMLQPLWVMFAAFLLYFILALMLGMGNEILTREPSNHRQKES
jgi:heme exporter protein C